jgi:hypothetical protein
MGAHLGGEIMIIPALGDIRVISDGTNPSDLRLTSDRRRHIAKVYARSAAKDPEAKAIATLFAAASAMLAACQAVMPIGIDTENPNIPDDQVIPLDVTMGELRQLRAAITQATQDQGGGND